MLTGELFNGGVSCLVTGVKAVLLIAVNVFLMWFGFCIRGIKGSELIVFKSEENN